MLDHRRTMFRVSLLILLLLLGLSVASNPVVAQSGGPINYGGSAFGNVSAAAPLVIFNFSGAAGDLVTIRVSGTSPGMDPTVSLQSPRQLQLASNDNDFFSPGSTDARVSVRLQEAGVYSILVGGSGGTIGDFLLRLDSRPPTVSTALLPGVPTQVNIPFGAPSQSYSVNGEPVPTTITITTPTPGFGFTVELRDGSGQLIALSMGGNPDGSKLQGISFTLPAGDETFEIIVSSSDPQMQGTILLNVGAAGAPAAQQLSPVVQPAAPVQQPPAQPPPAVDPLAGIGPNGPCTLTPNPGSGNVNLRSGPGTTFPLRGQIAVGQAPNADAQTTGSDGIIWWRLPNLSWVRSDVVREAGNCFGLQVVPAPAPPAQPPGPATTQEPAPGGPPAGPTATPTPTPTSTPTSTPTQSGACPSVVPAGNSVSLSAGFLPDPFQTGITSGGSIALSNCSQLPQSCRFGFVVQNPDFSLTWGGGGTLLRIFWVGGGDGTLLINDANGNWRCADDSFGTLNPSIDFTNPASGRYDVWVGSLGQGGGAGGTLNITEIDSTHP